MNLDAWELMEAKARDIRAAKHAKQKLIYDKLIALREYNIAHPIKKHTDKVPTVTPDTSKSDDEIARESARWMGYYYRKMHTGWVIKKKR